jgi:predicted regulator of Ras-like GTPase activity (Roadblock/LC7/MglB family)
MKEILEELNRSISARGSLLMTRDAIPIAHAARAEFQVDRVSALAQKLIDESTVTCEVIGATGVATFFLTADYGRVVFLELPTAYLVVITNPNADMDQILLEIESAAREIERAVRIAM